MGRKLLYVVTEDWSFLLHRLPMARAARDAGYDVQVATRVGESRKQIEADGFTVHSIALKRGSLNPLALLHTIRDLRRLYAAIKPDLIHHVALAPAVLGSLASLGLHIRTVNSLTGLGFPLPEPEAPFTVGFAGRLLYDKGVHVLVDAQQSLRRRGLAVRLLIAGTPDPSNPASIPEETLRRWRNSQEVVLLGHVKDIGSLWAQAHIAVLPSRREGLPKSLLEAAACGRPMIATDVPGCREVVRPRQTGLLVPLEDAEALACAIETLMEDPGLRLSYGTAARRAAVEEFSSQRVGQDIVDLYRQLLSGKTEIDADE
jgi:glycosyltransferase involved in cell wall biosynthesis